MIRGMQVRRLVLQGTLWPEWPRADEALVWILDTTPDRKITPTAPVASQLVPALLDGLGDFGGRTAQTTLQNGCGAGNRIVAIETNPNSYLVFAQNG